ncbi:DUF4868 domain-containing protein [Levilactobacillus humaensis]|uniref:DUF4868 domain-containing protein n=1 Tax=Levilactobacillus humaensis TaxID=2950375 RepID=UPI0021C2BB38|nr:DUF4868 domain-containing protein [Levilactobacillus humaensis]
MSQNSSINLEKITKESIQILQEDNYFSKVSLFLFTDQADSSIQVYTPDLPKESVQKKLLEIFVNQFRNKRYRNKEVEHFDITTQSKKKFYSLKTSEFNTIKPLPSKLTDEAYTDFNDLKIDDFIGYCAELSLPSGKLHFFSNFGVVNKVKRNGFLANLHDGKLTGLTKPVFGFNTKISFLQMNDDILILGTTNLFERIFELDKFYKQEAVKFIDRPQTAVFISNPEDMSADVEDDTVSARRLTKLARDSRRIKYFEENYKRVKKVIESKDPEFKKFSVVEFDTNGKLLFSKKTKRELITLIADAPYESIIGHRSGIDPSM